MNTPLEAKITSPTCLEFFCSNKILASATEIDGFLILKFEVIFFSALSYLIWSKGMAIDSATPPFLMIADPMELVTLLLLTSTPSIISVDAGMPFIRLKYS